MEGLVLGEDLDADSLSSVFEPGTVIAHSVMIVKLTHTVAHVVGPLSLISLTFDVSKFTIAVGVPQVPRTFESCSILEQHSSLTMAESAKPFTLVHCSTCEVVMLSLNEILGQLTFIVIKEQVQLDLSFWTNRLKLILCQEVS